MPDLITFAITFAIAVVAALLVAWSVGHIDWLADFLNLERA